MFIIVLANKYIMTCFDFDFLIKNKFLLTILEFKFTDLCSSFLTL